MNDARTIRKMYETDRFTQKQLAAVFGVSQGMIGRIINNKAHVDHAFGFGGESGVSVHYNLV
jgi:predicted transcriptional regulator